MFASILFSLVSYGYCAVNSIEIFLNIIKSIRKKKLTRDKRTVVKAKIIIPNVTQFSRGTVEVSSYLYTKLYNILYSKAYTVHSALYIAIYLLTNMFYLKYILPYAAIFTVCICTFATYAISVDKTWKLYIALFRNKFKLM